MSKHDLTLGEVAMVGDSVVITAKDGLFQVRGNGSALDVVKGKTITIPAKLARDASPSPAKPGSVGGGVSLILQAATLGASATGGTLGGIGIVRSGDARDNAGSADEGVKGAIAAANAANATANAVGCALNVLASEEGLASPYTPAPRLPPC